MRKLPNALGALAAAAALTPLPDALSQGANLSQPAALQRAISILKGDPYGKTAAEVQKHIVGSALAFPGSRTLAACGPMRKPVWVFDVAVPAKPGSGGHDAISGALVLDAATGRLDCASLPFLD